MLCVRVDSSGGRGERRQPSSDIGSSSVSEPLELSSLESILSDMLMLHSDVGGRRPGESFLTTGSVACFVLRIEEGDRDEVLSRFPPLLLEA